MKNFITKETHIDELAHMIVTMVVSSIIVTEEILIMVISYLAFIDSAAPAGKNAIRSIEHAKEVLLKYLANHWPTRCRITFNGELLFCFFSAHKLFLFRINDNLYTAVSRFIMFLHWVDVEDLDKWQYAYNGLYLVRRGMPKEMTQKTEDRKIHLLVYKAITECRRNLLVRAEAVTKLSGILKEHGLNTFCPTAYYDLGPVLDTFSQEEAKLFNEEEISALSGIDYYYVAEDCPMFTCLKGIVAESDPDLDEDILLERVLAVAQAEKISLWMLDSVLES